MKYKQNLNLKKGCKNSLYWVCFAECSLFELVETPFSSIEVRLFVDMTMTPEFGGLGIGNIPLSVGSLLTSEGDTLRMPCRSELVRTPRMIITATLVVADNVVFISSC